MKRYFSFTLVEILAVTVLVSLLAAIGFAGYGYAMNASRRAATESLIQQISAGLENFKIKNGYYPASSTYTEIAVTKNSDDLLDSITFGSTKWTKGTNKEFNVFFKPLDQEKIKKNISGDKLVDSWGGSIYYKYPGTVNTTGFDLIAPGEDGKFGKNASDTASSTGGLSAYKDGSDWACDDISNFMDK
ncbi:MAG: hypothetical protein IKA32_09805 [Lentisphaeria bacterium]|nr:hypothetical protein [Lentisphaeria bacterium]